MLDYNLFSIENKVAIITGSGRGIGRAIALGFARAGAKVAINVSKNIKQGEETLAMIHHLDGQAILVQADVSRIDDVEKLVSKTIEHFGSFEILINNAGIVAGYPSENIDLGIWNRVLEVNLTGVYLCSAVAAKRAFIPQKYGRIINISSISAEIGHPGGKPGLQQAAYHASKGGVNALSRALALEWVSYGITVNTISPGWINTGIDDDFFKSDPNNLKLVLDDTPMHRLGEPCELVGTAIFLSSEASSFITGQNIVVDGGYTCW